MSEQLSTPAVKRPWYRHAGSIIAMVLGVLYFLSSLITHSDGLTVGLMMVMAAIAYRSAKGRALGENNGSTFRQIVEGLLMLVVLAGFLLRNNLNEQIAVHPISALIILIGCIIAYLIQAGPMWTRRKSK